MQPSTPTLEPPATRRISGRLPSWVLSPQLPDSLIAIVYRFRRGLICFVLAAYLLGFNGHWRLEPDAALYLSLGRNLAERSGYTHLGKPHHLAYPGLPWIIAGTFRVFGTPHVWPAHVVMLGFALATLGLVYRLFLLHSDRPTAVFLTIGLAVTKTFYRYAYELRPDMPFLFGVVAFLCGYEAIFAHPERALRHRWYDWALLAGGLCVATVMRPTIWVLVLAVAVAAGWSAVRGHLRWKTLLPFLLGVALLVVAFRHFDPRFAASGSDDYETFAWQSLTKNFQATLHTVLHKNLHELLAVATPDALMQVRFGYGNIVLAIAFIALGLGLVRQHLLWGVLVGLIVVMNALVPPLDRYYLPVLPLMVYAWWLGMQTACTRWPGRATNVIVLSLLSVGLGSNLEKIGGIILEQRRTPFLQHYQNGKFVPVVKMAREIQTKVSAGDLVLVQHGQGRIMSYLSHRYVADPRDFAGLDLTGRPLFVVEPTDPATENLLLQNHLAPGPSVARVPGNKVVYSLDRVVPAAAR